MNKNKLYYSFICILIIGLFSVCFTELGKHWPAVTSCLWSTSSCSSVKFATTPTCLTHDPSSLHSSRSASSSTRPLWHRRLWSSLLWKWAQRKPKLRFHNEIVPDEHFFLRLFLFSLSAATFPCLTSSVWRAVCLVTRQMCSCRGTRSVASWSRRLWSPLNPLQDPNRSAWRSTGTSFS